MAGNFHLATGRSYKYHSVNTEWSGLLLGEKRRAVCDSPRAN